MINESKFTTWSCNIDVQHFATQEWQNCGEIEMQHIPGVINLADDKTKALSWILHSHHSKKINLVTYSVVLCLYIST